MQERMNFLITGGAGFIGSNLIHHVIDRPEVAKLVNLDCLTYAGRLENLAGGGQASRSTSSRRWICGTRPPSSTSCSATASPTSCTWRPSLTWTARSPAPAISCTPMSWAPSTSWKPAAPAAGRTPAAGHRFHHVSTDEVYGSLGPTGLFTETTPYAPNSPYSASKASSDMLVRAYHHTYGLPTVITNCSNNYGPYQFPEKLIPVVIQSVLARKPVPVYGDGMNVRDWLYVRDHAEALWVVLTRGRAGETYNIGGHNEWANLHIVQLICDLIDEMAPQLGGDSRKLITFVKDRPGHDRRYAIDATKIEKELGWLPAHKFEQGIRETVRWYLDNQEWVRSVLKR